MSVAMEEGPRRHRITVDEYYRMAEVGLLAPDARVELIEGEIIDVPPIGPGHASAVSRLNQILVHVVMGRAIVRCQDPIRLDEFSEPQPDFTVLLPRKDFYSSRHPSASDTLLVIEVSDTSLRYDLQRKMPLYARHGIPELWILDVRAKRLQVFRNPSGAAYVDVLSAPPPSLIPISSLTGASIDMSSLFDGDE